MNDILEFFKANGFTMAIVAGVIIIVALVTVVTVVSCKLADRWSRKKESERLLQEIEMHQREKKKYQEQRDKMIKQREEAQGRNEAQNQGPSEAESSETQPLTQDS
ncbi:unnamed protein product [Caenorhabditis nigoni]